MPSSRVVLVPFPLSPRRTLAACIAVVSLSTACGGRTFDLPVAADNTSSVDVSQRDGGASGPGAGDGGAITKPDAGSSDAALPDASSFTLPDAAGTRGCLQDSDCDAGGKCSFASSVGQCSVGQNPVGQCLPPGPRCNSLPGVALACGCDGQDIVWDYGCNGVSATYVPAGIAHTRPCTDAALPVISCVNDIMCPQGLQCGYDIGEGCHATGQCVAPEALGGGCQCTGVPACACDGTTELLSCCALFASKPVASRNGCGDAGGGSP